jgi:hypothetical protein
MANNTKKYHKYHRKPNMGDKFLFVNIRARNLKNQQYGCQSSLLDNMQVAKQ